ncbi:protein inturned-like [Ptychodera flava]|uniref:protein inturned-like n=1 Tax=Ptychodera flava TaxID=63121 RepID=UPI00396A87D2
MTQKFQRHNPYDNFSTTDSESGEDTKFIVGDSDAKRRWDTKPKGQEESWVGSIEENGDLFYLEQDDDGQQDLSNYNQNGGLPANGKVKNRKGFHRIKRIMKGKNEEENKLHLSMSDPNLSTSFNEFSSNTREHNLNGVPKNVSVFLNPGRANVGGQTLLEELFGIIPGKCSTKRVLSPVTSPRRRSDIRYDGLSHDYEKIIVQGLLPTGVAMKTGQISIGDSLVAINGIPVNFDNIDRVLSTISVPEEVIIQVERPELNKDRLILQPRRILPNGSLVKLITGNKVEETNSVIERVPHVVMYLSLAGDLADSEESKEMLYVYPENGASHKLSEIQGMFLTISDMLEKVTGTRVTSSTVVVSRQLLNVSYFKNGPEALVVAMPANRVTLSQLNHIVTDLTRLLNLLYRSLHDAFLPSLYQAKLDHLFSLVFQNHLLEEHGMTLSLDSNTAVFLDTLLGAQWLDLSENIKVTVDSALCELEAADFAEMSDEHYDDRRPYVIVGSCLFHRGYLLANHLELDDFIDTLLYCRYHGLLVLASEARIGQLVIWREIHPTKKQRPRTSADGYVEQDTRHFILIIGLKQGLLCTILEAGGCAAKAVGHPSPDPFYIDQAKATLQHLESINIPATCEERLSNMPVPALSSADWFMSSRSSTIETGTPPPVPGSPMLSRLHGSSQLKGTPSKKQQLLSPDAGQRSKKQPGSPSVDKHKNVGRSSAYEVDSDDGSDESAYSPANSQQSTPILPRRSDDKRRESIGSVGSAGSGSGSVLFKSSRKQRIIPDPFNMAVLRKGLTETEAPEFHNATKLSAGCDNTLFHFASLDVGQGVIVTPTHKDIQLLGGIVHPRLVKNFERCCLSIRHTFQQSMKSKQKSRKSKTVRFHCNKSLKVVKEHGVLLQSLSENASDQKKKPQTMQYWVVGRQYGDPFPREVYVCYHESATQNSVEIAFKLGFGAGL